MDVLSILMAKKYAQSVKALFVRQNMSHGPVLKNGHKT